MYNQDKPEIKNLDGLTFLKNSNDEQEQFIILIDLSGWHFINLYFNSSSFNICFYRNPLTMKPETPTAYIWRINLWHYCKWRGMTSQIYLGIPDIYDVVGVPKTLIILGR